MSDFLDIEKKESHPIAEQAKQQYGSIYFVDNEEFNQTVEKINQLKEISDETRQEVIGIATGMGGQSHYTHSEALAVSPLPENGVMYTLRKKLANGTTNQAAGIYSYDSTSESGYRYVSELPVTKTLSRSENQLFNKNDYEAGSISSSNTSVVTEGAGRTKYINIPTEDRPTEISFSGLGASAARRIAWVTGLDGSGTLASVNTINSPSGTVAIPVTANSFRFFFKRLEDGNVEETFMLNYGAPMVYEPFDTISELDGMTIKDKEVLQIESIQVTLAGTSPTVNESGWYKATPVVQDVVLKGNTGLGYDLKRNLFIVSEYNSTISSRLLFFRKEDLVERNTGAPQISVPFKTIDLTAHIDHIQGCTWDFVDDTYLALGTLKTLAPGTTNSVVVKVSPMGVILEIIPLGDNLTVQVGMIDILLDGNIIIKPNAGNSAYIYNRSYGLVDRKDLLSSEGLCVNKYTGDIWCADDDFTVKKFNKNYKEIATYSYNTFTNESGRSNVEGMCILPDGSLVISADAYLHGGTQLGNSLFFFDFESSVNKKLNVYLPNGIGKFDNFQGEYITEILKTPNAVTSVEVISNFSTRKSYRQAASKPPLANQAFVSSLTTAAFSQIKISQ